MTGTGREETAVRVAVVADRELVGHAVCTALVDRGVHAVPVRWSRARRDVPVARELAVLAPDAGVLLCALDPLAQVAHARWLVAQSPVEWLVLSEHHAWPGAGAMLEAGCVGVWPADSRLSDVGAWLRGLRHRPAEEGRPDDQLRRWRALPRRTRAAVGRLALLSARERCVAMDLVAGLRVEQIAARDGVAVTTVRTQVRAVLRKLEVHSQLEAVTLVRSLGGAPARWGSPCTSSAPPGSSFPTDPPTS